MDNHHPNQSLSKNQHPQVVHPDLDEPCCNTTALQAESVTKELLGNDDLSHIVGGANEESSRLDNLGLLHSPSGEDNSPFELSPTYPSPPNLGDPPDYSSQK